MSAVAVNHHTWPTSSRPPVSYLIEREDSQSSEQVPTGIGHDVSDGRDGIATRIPNPETR